jgi:hypothetical protein
VFGGKRLAGVWLTRRPEADALHVAVTISEDARIGAGRRIVARRRCAVPIHPQNLAAQTLQVLRQRCVVIVAGGHV